MKKPVNAKAPSLATVLTKLQESIDKLTEKLDSLATPVAPKQPLSVQEQINLIEAQLNNILPIPGLLAPTNKELKIAVDRIQQNIESRKSSFEEILDAAEEEHIKQIDAMLTTPSPNKKKKKPSKIELNTWEERLKKAVK